MAPASGSNPQDARREQSSCSGLDGEYHFTLDPKTNTVRSSFGLGPGTRVKGWPSKGGVYLLRDCNGLELDFLQVDRFKPALRSDDQAQEDEHCARMRQLGAAWWESDQAFVQAEIFRAKKKQNLPDPVIMPGWPDSGGVWVLTKPRKTAAAMGTGMIRLARDMEERCRLIKEFGGTFYEDPKDCPDLDLA